MKPFARRLRNLENIPSSSERICLQVQNVSFCFVFLISVGSNSPTLVSALVFIIKNLRPPKGVGARPYAPLLAAGIGWTSGDSLLLVETGEYFCTSLRFSRNGLNLLGKPVFFQVFHHKE